MFVSEDNLTFTSSIGYDGGMYHADVFKRALGRFICYLVILLKGQEDLQNSLDLLFTTYNMGIICFILQILVALFLPVAFVFSLSSSENFLQDITKTGLLRIFIELDTQVFKLVMMGHKEHLVEGFTNLKTICVFDNVRKWVRIIVIPLYMFGFFLISWYAAMQMYPLAFIFFAFTLGIYSTPYCD